MIFIFQITVIIVVAVKYATDNGTAVSFCRCRYRCRRSRNIWPLLRAPRAANTSEEVIETLRSHRAHKISQLRASRVSGMKFATVVSGRIRTEYGTQNKISGKLQALSLIHNLVVKLLTYLILSDFA
jgi:hypothetical protein